MTDAEAALVYAQDAEWEQVERAVAGRARPEVCTSGRLDQYLPWCRWTSGGDRLQSYPLRAERKETVEVLLCATLRAGHTPGADEVVLDGADGLDWSTLCRGELICSIPRHDLTALRGKVSLACQREIIRNIIFIHGWV